MDHRSRTPKVFQGINRPLFRPIVSTAFHAVICDNAPVGPGSVTSVLPPPAARGFGRPAPCFDPLPPSEHSTLLKAVASGFRLGKAGIDHPFRGLFAFRPYLEIVVGCFRVFFDLRCTFFQTSIGNIAHLSPPKAKKVASRPQSSNPNRVFLERLMPFRSEA